MPKLPRDVFNLPARAKSDRIRPLHAPRPCHVERGRFSMDGRNWVEIAAIADEWIITDQWWREEFAEDRRYLRLRLADEQVVTVYEDRVRGGWYRQEYSPAKG